LATKTYSLSDTRLSHTQPAHLLKDIDCLNIFDRCRKWTGFAYDNGFGYFSRKKSNSNWKFIPECQPNWQDSVIKVHSTSMQ